MNFKKEPNPSTVFIHSIFPSIFFFFNLGVKNYIRFGFKINIVYAFEEIIL